MSQIRLLIAEDDHIVRAALIDMATRDQDFELVGTAADADEAIRLVAKHRPDVALVDVKMPGGGGEKAVREIRDHTPQTKTLVLSAYDDKATVLRLLRAGATGYLVKGAPTQRIREAIRLCSQGQSSLATEVTADVVHELVALLERSEAQAQQLEALDSMKSELIQMLAHELLTPTTVLQGAALTLARQSGELSAEEIEMLGEAVGRGASRISRLSTNVTASARLATEQADLKMRPVPMAHLLSKVRPGFPGRLHRIVMPDKKTTAGIEVWADADLAVAAVSAVIENALDLSPDDAAVEITLHRAQGEVQMLISDRGPGIPEEMRQRVFESFTQVDASATRPHEGIGIGLYLASRIMRAHRGSIDVHPREGGGSTFSLAFQEVVGGRDSEMEPSRQRS